MLALIAAVACGQYQACQTRVAAPAYTYQRAAVAAPVYAAPQQAYADQVLFVAVADPRYSAIVGSHERDTKAAPDQLAVLTNQVVQLQASIASMVGRGAAAAPEPPAPGLAPPQPPRQVFGAQPSATDTAVLATLQRKCAQCHSDATAVKGFKMFANGAPLPLSAIQKGMAYLMVDGGVMPPDASLSPEEFTLLKNYLGEDRASIVAALKTCASKP